jgi:hypothetical protein
MLKILNPTIHGALDYALALTFLFIPGVLGFPHAAAVLSQIFGVIYIGASLLTRYPLGALRLIPFPVHGVIESIMAVTWIVIPWIFGFGNHAPARSFFLLAGVGLLAVVFVTDYQATGAGRAAGLAHRNEERRHRLVDRRERMLAVATERRRQQFDRRSYAGG